MTENDKARRANCLVLLIIFFLSSIVLIRVLGWWSLLLFGVVAAGVAWWAMTAPGDDHTYPETPVDPVLVGMTNQQIGILEEIKKMPEHKRAPAWNHYNALKAKENAYKKSKE